MSQWQGLGALWSKQGTHRPIGSASASPRKDPPSFGRFATELAVFNFGTQALINISLVATQGARASFLVQMSVVFTPVVSVCVGEQRVSRRVWIACFVALAGLFVLSYSEAAAEDDNDNNYAAAVPSLTFSWGDWCCLSAALCWSLYIYRLSAWGDCFDETMTQFVKNIVLASLYTLWMVASLASGYFNDVSNNNDGQEVQADDESWSLWKGWRNDPIAWLILFYSALGPCTLADVFQQTAQSSVPAAETNVILSLEPVFTTLLGFVLLRETPSLQELCGGLLITIASVVASCSGPPPPSETAISR
jgi:drug/metabolite transporter (DMT)-like permease